MIRCILVNFYNYYYNNYYFYYYYFNFLFVVFDQSAKFTVIEIHLLFMVWWPPTSACHSSVTAGEYCMQSSKQTVVVVWERGSCRRCVLDANLALLLECGSGNIVYLLLSDDEDESVQHIIHLTDYCFSYDLVSSVCQIVYSPILADCRMNWRVRTVQPGLPWY